MHLVKQWPLWPELWPQQEMAPDQAFPQVKGRLVFGGAEGIRTLTPSMPGTFGTFTRVPHRPPEHEPFPRHPPRSVEMRIRCQAVGQACVRPACALRAAPLVVRVGPTERGSRLILGLLASPAMPKLLNGAARRAASAANSGGRDLPTLPN